MYKYRGLTRKHTFLYALVSSWLIIYLITGGAKNGKSEFGEGICAKVSKGTKCYIATMYRNLDDEETSQRIIRHRLMRQNKGFETIERFTELKNMNFGEYNTAILECVPNLLANEMFMSDKGWDATEEVMCGISVLCNTVPNVVIITNEIFQDGFYYSKETQEYINRLGDINRKLANLSNKAYEVVCGIPVRFK